MAREAGPLPAVGPAITAMATDARGRIYAAALRQGRTAGVYRAQGTDWSWQGGDVDLGLLSGSSSEPIDELFVDPNQPDVVFFRMRWMLFRAVNGGQTWESLPMGGESFGYPSFASDPLREGVYYAATGRLWRSGDFGVAWVQMTMGWRWRRGCTCFGYRPGRAP